MKNDFVNILDFGSGKITCMAASCADNGDFVIRAVGQSVYNGFDADAWYEPDKLSSAVSAAVSQIESKLHYKIKEIYVGVPGAFCSVAVGEAGKAFHSKKKIDAEDVNDLTEKADVFGEQSGSTLIGSSPVYFVIDEAIKVYDPVGLIANKISAQISFSYMKKYFANSVSKALADSGVNKIVYLNACEAQANYISLNRNVNGYAIIIDVGHISSSVMLSGGRGLLFCKTFTLGTGYFAGDLYQVLGCDYAVALKLLGKIDLNLEFLQGDDYLVDGVSVDALNANEIVRSRIEQIGDYVMRAFSACDKEIPYNTPIILTGGGLAYLRGGPECLAGALGRAVKLYSSVNPQTSRNEYTSCYGLISSATSDALTRRGHGWSIFSKLRGNK